MSGEKMLIHMCRDDGCQGDHVDIEKNNSNILGPGPVNLTDVNFDDRASSWSCY